MARHSVLMIAFSALMAGSVAVAYAQDDPFQQALAAFESGAYEEAYQGFVAHYGQDSAGPNATAALFMAGKALYRSGAYTEAINHLTRLLARHPATRYREEAEEVIAFARLRQRNQEAQIWRLGVALPLNVADPSTTQALFNGIHAAVALHNDQGRTQVEIVFRDTHERRGGAADAVRELISADVDAIIGPLNSADVRRVARVADAARTVMVAPLASGQGITANYRHVFQASPSPREHGRFVARAAIQQLGFTRLGVVSEIGRERSEEQARGFAEGASALGVDVEFHLEITSPDDWERIPELVSSDTLRRVEALYLPVHGESVMADRRIVESMLVRLGLAPQAPVILGTNRWREVTIRLSPRELTIYYPDPLHIRSMRTNVRSFAARYRALGLGRGPSRFAYIGYDVASLLLDGLAKGGNLLQHMERPMPYEGAGIRMRFNEDGTNTALFLMHLNSQGNRLAY